jgi:rod shape determining protein RodA
MTPLLRKFLGFNWPLVLVMLVLAAAGPVAIYAASYWRPDPSYYYHRQIIWLAIAVVVFFITSFIDYRWIKAGSLPIYLATLVLLVVTIKFAREINGAKTWLRFGSLMLEPAQFAPLAGIMMMALFLTQFSALHPALRLMACGAIAGAPMLLILMQHALGETIVWVPVLLAMLFVGGLPLRYLISLLLTGFSFLPLVYYLVLTGNRRSRITVWFDPEVDPRGAGWGITQSLIAIGSGGWSGKGFCAPNTQVEQGFIPKDEVHTDYIFVSIAEQWGFVGGVILVCVFAVLLLICLYIAWRSADHLGVLLVGGITAMLFYHVLQNVGMVIRLLPITGLPLPLVSYSGTFALTVMFALGLVNSVWVHRKALP